MITKYKPLPFALEYAKRGWGVLPLHTPDEKGHCSCHKLHCTNVGKHPRTMNGCKDATTNEEIIRKWWEKWPDANVAIATGIESGIFVLDIDPRHGGDKSLKILEQKYGNLPTTLKSRTGSGGWHLFFRHPGATIPNLIGKIGSGLDLRGDGGYVVAPPSLHQSGAFYQWIHQ
jgi:hypothetical protein